MDLETTKQLAIEKEREKAKEALKTLNCPYCTYKTGSLILLKNHMVIAHYPEKIVEINGKKIGSCVLCGAKFKAPAGSRSVLCQHLVHVHNLFHFIVTHYEEDMAREDQKRQNCSSCPFCLEKVASSEEFKSHICSTSLEVAPEKRIYRECAICYHRTRSEDEMKQHLPTHFRRELVTRNFGIAASCRSCKLKFAWTPTLLTHLAFAHGFLGQICGQDKIDYSLLVRRVEAVKTEIIL